MFTNEDFRVEWGEYAKRHYARDFEKEVGGAWLPTRKALEAMWRAIDITVTVRKGASIIHKTCDNKQWIVKHDFKIAGFKESSKTSGRRVILYVNISTKELKVLLIYMKKHIGVNSYSNGNETTWWEQTIKGEYKDLLKDFNF